MCIAQSQGRQQVAAALAWFSGEDRIRTCGTELPVHRFSKPTLSTTQPPLQGTTSVARIVSNRLSLASRVPNLRRRLFIDMVFRGCVKVRPRIGNKSE